MSADMMTYLNYLVNLESATDDQLNDLINERAQFILLGKSDMMTSCDAAVDKVFDVLVSVSKKLEEEQIAQESVKLAEDAAAVAAIWSFGLSMAAFAALAITDAALGASIKSAEKDLNEKMARADTDISSQMGGACNAYITLYKANTAFIKVNDTGITAQTARSYVYNFMDHISKHGGLGLDNFKKYLHVARVTKDDPNINKIYDALDEFTLSGDHGENGIKKALKEIGSSGLNEATDALPMIRGFTFAIWGFKMKVSAAKIKAAAGELGAKEVPPDEVETSAFENMDAVGKVMAGITIALSVADAALQVYAIVETVERYNKTTSMLKDSRGSYKAFYKNLHDASASYTASDAPPAAESCK